MSTALQAVSSAMPQFERIASKNQLVLWDKESQFAIQAIQRNTLLAQCAPETIQDAVINVAAVGLTLNPVDQYAFLIPEYNKQSKRNECNLRISFRGLIKVANDSGAVMWVKAEVVKESDQFEYRGPCEKPTHIMNPFSARGATVGAYCIAKTHEGDYLVDVISFAEIEVIRMCAKTQNVWQAWPDEMAKKAIIKRASKQWPKTPGSERLHKAIAVINAAEGSDFDGLQKLQDTAAYICEYIEQDDPLAVGQAWAETTADEKSQLWVAITKGGFFTQDQKKYIRMAIAKYNESINAIDGEAEELIDGIPARLIDFLNDLRDMDKSRALQALAGSDLSDSDKALLAAKLEQ